MNTACSCQRSLRAGRSKLLRQRAARSRSVHELALGTLPHFGVPFYVSLSSPTSTATLTNTPLAATATALTSTRARAYPEISGLFSKRLQALVAAKPAHESGTAAAAGNIQMNAAFQRPAKARRADLGKLENVINGLFSGRRPATLLGAQPPVIAAQHEAQAGMVTAAKRPEMSAATDKRDNLVA